MVARDERALRPPRLHRYAEAALAVAMWMGVGWSLRLDANAYLLLGVPITVGFQMFVARRPLHTLWVRDAAHFRLDRLAMAGALAIAAAPIVGLMRSIALGAPGSFDLVRAAWLVSASVGAVGAAFAFRHFTRQTVRQLLACIATAGTLGVALTMATRLARPDAEPLTTRAVAIALMWFLLYLPVAFVLEEVFFRGAVDAHVHHPGEPRGIASAVIVSALWALWHLPIVPARQAVTATLAGLLAVHVAVGIPLSVYWRRSGNLAVPATTHAFIDAMRNALLS